MLINIRQNGNRFQNFNHGFDLAIKGLLILNVWHVEKTIHWRYGGVKILNAVKQQKAVKEMKFFKQQSSTEKTVKLAEMRLASFIVEHNIAITAVDHLVSVIKNLNLDENSVKKISCNRTKCTALINNAIGQTSFKILVDLLKNNKFSLLVDESTDHVAIKNLAIVVRLNINFNITDNFLALLSQLQTINIDPIKAKQNLKNFKNVMQTIRYGMNKIIDKIDSELLETEDELVPHKRRRYPRSDLSVLTNSKIEALEVCDSIIQHIRTRFTLTGHLIATALFMKEHFIEYQKNFPDQLLSDTVNAYHFLEKNRLKTELQVFYEREELQTIYEAILLLSLVSQEDMKYTSQETIKILKVLVTTHMSASEAE
ncbi:unnamed protein product [Psylliodes chrysocephalus]|uniref:DUF4371 domain-containing protein n=1 Tax=Psylliodes chrysocephalus TaxID=3402493 RepID=A0A9P0GHJ1_9CUCU|nr:unnamed protein product [Psylliodes chrysocephala]